MRSVGWLAEPHALQLGEADDMMDIGVAVQARRPAVSMTQVSLACAAEAARTRAAESAIFTLMLFMTSSFDGV